MHHRVIRSSLAAAAAGLVTAGGVALASAPSGSSAHHRPHLSEHRILRIAKQAAASSGDRRPTLIQHAEGTRHHANLVDSGDGVPGRQWCYLIAERGHFVVNAPGPPGAPSPRGSVLTLIVNASTGRVTDFGVSNRYPNLAKLGPVHTDLRRANQALRTLPMIQAFGTGPQKRLSSDAPRLSPRTK